MPEKVKRVIAGQAIVLEAGKQYLAARPMATKGTSCFTIAIYEHKAFHSNANPPAIVDLPPLTYDEAKEHRLNKIRKMDKGDRLAIT